MLGQFATLGPLGRIWFGAYHSSCQNELDAHPLVDARADITAALERSWLLISDDSMGGELQLLLGYELDAGEAATLAAAKSSGADLVLIDEREGRKWARRLGLRAVGTLGILLRAKRDRKLLSLRESMRLLTEVYGFSISPDLLNEACSAVGEWLRTAGGRRGSPRGAVFNDEF